MVDFPYFSPQWHDFPSWNQVDGSRCQREGVSAAPDISLSASWMLGAVFFSGFCGVLLTYIYIRTSMCIYIYIYIICMYINIYIPAVFVNAYFVLFCWVFWTSYSYHFASVKVREIQPFRRHWTSSTGPSLHEKPNSHPGLCRLCGHPLSF